jgi:hypothetical protein
MVEAVAAGMPPHQFWDSTHREIYALLAGAALKARRDHKLTLWGHWQGQNLRRSKRLPDLKQLLRKLDPARVMSGQAIRAAILGIAESMGAKVVRKSKPKE